MPDEILPILTKFHREVLLPDIQRIVSDAVGSSERRLRDEMQTGFDALAQRLDRLETEYQMIVAGLKRMEERLDRMAFKADVQDLKRRVEALEHKLAELEGEL